MRDFWKHIAIGGAFVAAAALCSGACNPFNDGGDAVLVEEVYTVKQGDTLWDIAEEYTRKNTGTRRYILEYKSGIEELNPWLLDRKGEIYPGDKITLTYWVRGEGGGKNDGAVDALLRDCRRHPADVASVPHGGRDSRNRHRHLRRAGGGAQPSA